MSFEDLTKEIPFELPIKEILLGRGVAKKAAQLCAGLGKLHLVADENTAGFVQLDCTKTILSGAQKPTVAKAEELSKNDADCFVAVGSGSLNDMVKYAAFLAGKPYVVFATAPSMNGYASANVSLLPPQGLKKSYLARAPQAVFLDLDILEAAPKQLRIAGIGDSICRAVVQADCLLAHKLIGEPNYAEFFELMQRYEAQMFESVEALAKTLIFSGVAMLMAKSSAPASGAEHMLAHFMELEQPDAPHRYHGEQIAVTTVAMAEIQLAKLQQDFEVGELVAVNAETEAKYSRIKPQKIMAADFAEIVAHHAAIKTLLEEIGAPTKPEHLGWNVEIFERALQEAKLTRDRFTFLDLA